MKKMSFFIVVKLLTSFLPKSKIADNVFSIKRATQPAIFYSLKWINHLTSLKIFFRQQLYKYKLFK